MRSDNQITGNVGLYYVCYQLSCMGWNVMPTARNARGVDVIAYKGTRARFIQVKALSKRNPVPLGKSLEAVTGDFWVIVHVNRDRADPKAFIMYPNEVKSGAAERTKDGRTSYWLQPKDYEQEIFSEQWERIEFKDSESEQ